MLLAAKFSSCWCFLRPYKFSCQIWCSRLYKVKTLPLVYCTFYLIKWSSLENGWMDATMNNSPPQNCAKRQMLLISPNLTKSISQCNRILQEFIIQTQEFNTRGPQPMETAATLQNYVSTPQLMTHHSLETLSSRISKVCSNSNQLWIAALKLAEDAWGWGLWSFNIYISDSLSI